METAHLQQLLSNTKRFFSIWILMLKIKRMQSVIRENKCWPILVQGLQRDFWNKLIIFKHFNNNASLAQLVECQTVDLNVPGSNLGWGEFFPLKLFLMRKWAKLEKNNKDNSNNSLVFGRRPQTKRDLEKGKKRDREEMNSKIHCAKFFK